jgi:hypothetical protein
VFPIMTMMMIMIGIQHLMLSIERNAILGNINYDSLNVSMSACVVQMVTLSLFLD